jgi:WD40 repeat protein
MPLLRLISFGLFAILLLACGAEDPTAVSHPSARLAVVVVTIGTDQDPDGYVLHWADSTIRVSSSDSVLIGSTPGTLSLTLSDIASNCRIDTSPAAGLPVQPNDTVRVDFRLHCDQLLGTVAVQVATVGPEPDPDGYTLILGDSSRSVTPNDSVSFQLPPGPLTAVLEGVAPNCRASRTPAASIIVAVNQVTYLSFAVTCDTTLGTLVLATSAAGPDQDPDGFDLGVGDFHYSLRAYDTITAVLPQGVYATMVTRLAPNCVADLAPPGPLHILPGDTLRVSVLTTCTATSGTLIIKTRTSGVDLDPDGYELAVADTALRLATTDSQTITLPVGPYTATLSDLAQNCTSSQGAILPIQVPAGGDVTLTLPIACVSTTGFLHLQVVTTGRTQDPDGYSFALGNQPPIVIQPNDSLLLDRLTPGVYPLALTGVAPNCSASISGTVTIVAPDTTSVLASVSCTLDLRGRILFFSSEFGAGDLVTVLPTGTGRERLTTTGSFKAYPQVSPDQSRLVYASNVSGVVGIYGSAPDGSNPIPLALGSLTATQPSISPDGSHIAYSQTEPTGIRTWLMNVDGSAKKPLLDDGVLCCDTDPSWSSRTNLIVFSRNGTLATVQPDGTGYRELPTPGIVAQGGVGSPDGALIAFVGVTADTFDLYTIAVDGSNLTRLTASAAQEDTPAWSPDGRSLVFAQFIPNPLRSQIMIMDLATKLVLNLSNNAFSEGNPYWVP